MGVTLLLPKCDVDCCVLSVVSGRLGVWLGRPQKEGKQMIDEAVKSFRELHAIYVANQNPTSFKNAMNAFDRICGLTGMNEVQVWRMLNA